MWAIRPIVGIGAVAGRGQRRGHVAVVVERRVGEADLLQLTDQQAAEVELARRARAAVAFAAGLRIDTDVALESVERFPG